MNCKELANVIALEAKLLCENINNAECQYDIGKERVRCIALRHTLNILNKQLSQWDKERYYDDRN